MKKIYSILALATAFCAFTPLAKAQDISKSGEWTEKDGLVYRKSISEPTTAGIYTISLESFTTGQITVTQESIPADIVLVLDTSGSMRYNMGSDSGSSNQRMNALKTAVNSFIDAIDENDLYIPNTNPKQPRDERLGNRISIITFAGSANTRKVLTTLDKASELKEVINGLSPSGSTYAELGMNNALAELQSDRIDDTRKIRTVVLFTDGSPGSGENWTAGGNSQTTTWRVANDVISTANTIKNMADESKKISSTVYTVTIQTNPSNYTKVYLGKTSSNWKNATNMGSRNTWNSTNIWSNGNGTQVAGGPGQTNYAFATTDTEELKSIFQTIASSSGGSTADLDNATVSQVDVVSASFSLPAGADKNSIEVYTVRYTGDTGTTHNFETKTVDGKVVENLIKAPNRNEKYLRKWTDDQDVAHADSTDVDAAITWDLTASQAGSSKKDLITVNGFDYANLWCGPDPTVTSGSYQGWHQGYKIVIKIPVKMDDEAVGGPSLNTNGPNSGIYVNGKNQFPFVSPVVSLPVNIHIRKEGLEVGESAKFKIERTSDGTTWSPVTSVFVTRTENDAKEGENAPITKIIGLPATDDSTPAKNYNYRIVEEPWTWSYISGTKTPTTTDDLEVNPFIFTNRKKENIDNKVKNGESKAFNTFLPGNTEGSYVDSKPRTTTTTTTTTP